MKSKLKTFDQWKENGRVVIKGSKAVRKNTHGKSLFSLDQTTELKSRQDYKSEWNKDYTEQETYDEEYYPLTAFDQGADY